MSGFTHDVGFAGINPDGLCMLHAHRRVTFVSLCRSCALRMQFKLLEKINKMQLKINSR